MSAAPAHGDKLAASMGTAAPNLDLLRALAVTCVFGSHVHIVLVQRSTELAHHVGQLGVIMFFVHTSLVLMGSLERSRLTGRARIVEFLVHRVFRIYPLSVTCVLIAALLPGAAWSPLQLFANLTLTQNLLFQDSMVGGLWTLPLEVQMYLVLPVLFLVLRGRPAYVAIGVWLLALPVALLQPHVSGRLGVLAYVPCFLPGLVAWRLRGRAFLPGWLWPLAIIVTALPWLLSAGNQMAPRWATCMLLGLAIPCFREWHWRPVNRIGHLVARYSYGIYLTHYAALMVAFRVLEATFEWQLAAFIAMAVGFPLLAFHLVERPMIIIGKRVGARLARPFKTVAEIPAPAAR